MLHNSEEDGGKVCVPASASVCKNVLWKVRENAGKMKVLLAGARGRRAKCDCFPGARGHQVKKKYSPVREDAVQKKKSLRRCERTPSKNVLACACRRHANCNSSRYLENA